VGMGGISGDGERLAIWGPFQTRSPTEITREPSLDSNGFCGLHLKVVIKEPGVVPPASDTLGVCMDLP